MSLNDREHARSVFHVYRCCTVPFTNSLLLPKVGMPTIALWWWLWIPRGLACQAAPLDGIEGLSPPLYPVKLLFFNRLWLHVPPTVYH